MLEGNPSCNGYGSCKRDRPDPIEDEVYRASKLTKWADDLGLRSSENAFPQQQILSFSSSTSTPEFSFLTGTDVESIEGKNAQYVTFAYYQNQSVYPNCSSGFGSENMNAGMHCSLNGTRGTFTPAQWIELEHQTMINICANVLVPSNTCFGSENMNAGMHCSLNGTRGTFTPAQWIELEHQTMIYRYICANVPVPSNTCFGSENMNAGMHCSLNGTRGTFTPAQWIELEHQTMIYRYICANVPVPSNTCFGSENMNAGMHCSLNGTRGTFTPAQWIELEHQTMIYRYICANVPVPSNTCFGSENMNAGMHCSLNGTRGNFTPAQWIELEHQTMIYRYICANVPVPSNTCFGSENMNAGMHCSLNGTRGTFTPAQWIELEHQTMIYRYICANVPVPSNTCFGSENMNAGMHCSLNGIRGTFTPAQWIELENQTMIYGYICANVPVPSNTYGWGPFHIGFDRTDLEPERCRRTDGKKWRCSKDAVPDHKYCEKHVKKGRARSRKPVECQTVTGSTSSKVVPPMSAPVVASSVATAQHLNKGLQPVNQLYNHEGLSRMHPSINSKSKDSPFSIPKHQIPMDEYICPEFGLVSNNSVGCGPTIYFGDLRFEVGSISRLKQGRIGGEEKLEEVWKQGKRFPQWRESFW